MENDSGKIIFWIIVAIVLLNGIDGGGGLDPSPISDPGLRVMVIKQTDKSQSVPYDFSGTASGAFVDFLRANCVKGADGEPQYRILSAGTTDLSRDLPVFKKLWDHARPKAKEEKDYPYIIATNGSRYYEGPMLKSTTEELARLKPLVE